MQMTKEQVLEERFNWLGGAKKKSGADVSINRVYWNKQDMPDVYAYSFVFRNEAANIGERIQLAFYKNRIMIKPSDIGYKLTCRTDEKNGNRYFKVKRDEDTKELDKFIGDFSLGHEEFFDIYYIEREE